jgi:hypothetical protein
MVNITASFSKIILEGKAFKDAWDTIVRGIAGRWGKDTYKPYAEELASYIMTKNVVNCSWSPVVRGNVTINLPAKAGNDGIIFLLIDNVLSAKAIFRGMDVVTLPLVGTTILVTMNYEVME